MSAFTFISSYRGEHDYRRRADGKRYRMFINDPSRTLFSTESDAYAPADALAEWRAFRLAERVELHAWCVRKGLEPEDIAACLADGFPELPPFTA
jgi:hypothetical protein